MRQVIEERGLLEVLIAANGGKLPPGECSFCKASRKKQEQLLREAQAAAGGQDEPEGTTEDVLRPRTSKTCCMRKCLSEQADFKAEKPLLQVVLEEARHKCYFLPKFHCELNPIAIYWGWTKTRELFNILWIESEVYIFKVSVPPQMACSLQLKGWSLKY